MGEDERGAGDVADFAGAGGDVLEGERWCAVLESV